MMGSHVCQVRSMPYNLVSVVLHKAAGTRRSIGSLRVLSFHYMEQTILKEFLGAQ
eukprot:SAG31_NODE_444_length_15625_cov_6.047469_8_plen_55_part_00